MTRVTPRNRGEKRADVYCTTLHIGITYDLRDDYLRAGYSAAQTAEFDGVETIDGIDDALRKLGHTTDRVGNVRALVARLAEGERWDLVFNIAEGLTGFGRESQVPALLEAYSIPYTFSDPLVLAIALHKGMAKRLVRDLGIPTPDFQVVECGDPLDTIPLPLPCFAKPVAGGTSMGISTACKITKQSQFGPVCAELRQRFAQPVLLEAFLPGREFTVGVLGTNKRARVLGVMEVVLLENAEPEIYSYRNKQRYRDCVRYRLADPDIAAAAETMALAVWRGLGCRDAGRVDLRCDSNGQLQFLELNPLAGLHPVDSDLVILSRLIGMKYEELIRQIVESATR